MQQHGATFDSILTGYKAKRIVADLRKARETMAFRAWRRSLTQQTPLAPAQAPAQHEQQQKGYWAV